MLEELKWWELILIIAAIVGIMTAIIESLKYFFRKNRPIIVHISHSGIRNYLIIEVITNVNYAVTIKKVLVKLKRCKSKRLGFGFSIPNNEIHSDKLASSGISNISPIINQGHFNVYLPINFKPSGFKFIVYSDTGKMKKVYE